MGLFDRFKKKNSEKDVVKKKQSAEKTNKIKSGTKRKTLVKDFDEIFERGNEEEIKAIFEKCDINAYGGYDKTNALSFKPVSYTHLKMQECPYLKSRLLPQNP